MPTSLFTTQYEVLDMPPFDPRGQNEAGYPWEAGCERINPAYFDMADLRTRWLVREGLMPLIYGGWGYYLPLLGLEKMKRHLGIRPL
jgi:hypothetical protein